jgi:hypothetical protein
VRSKNDFRKSDTTPHSFSGRVGAVIPIGQYAGSIAFPSCMFGVKYTRMQRSQSTTVIGEARPESAKDSLDEVPSLRDI